MSERTDNPWPWAPPKNEPDIPVQKAAFAYCVVCKGTGPADEFVTHEGRYVHMGACREKLMRR